MSSYEYNKKWRKEHPEEFREQQRKHVRRYNHKYPGKRYFTVTVYNLIKRGFLKKQPCSMCGGTHNLQACTLSESPNSPVWFCCSCHKKFHDLISKFSIIKHIG